MIPQETTSSPTCRSAPCSCAFAPTSTDGIIDLALSESSTWGNAGGQWLLFRGQSDGSYVYWGTLFFSPGGRRVRPLAHGTSEMALYVRMGVSRGTVQVYRVTSAEISRVSELALDLEHPSDRTHYEARKQRIAGGLGLGLQ